LFATVTSTFDLQEVELRWDGMHTRNCVFCFL
jgi:hypothetical protein